MTLISIESLSGRVGGFLLNLGPQSFENGFRTLNILENKAIMGLIYF